MGIGSKNINNIKINASSKNNVAKKEEEEFLYLLRKNGLKDFYIGDKELKTALKNAFNGDFDKISEYAENESNIDNLFNLFAVIKDYETGFAKNLAETISLPKEKNLISNFKKIFQNMKKKEIMPSFFITLFSKYLSNMNFKKEELSGMPKPFDLYWLSSAESKDKTDIMSIVKETMAEDITKGNSRNLKIIYGFLFNNKNLNQEVYADVLESSLQEHKRYRDIQNTESPFTDVLEYAFEYAPLHDNFEEVLKDTFPVLMDMEGKIGYKYGNYAYEDLNIVSHLFYNETVSLEKRNNIFLGIIDNYRTLANKVTPLPMNQFLEKVDFEKTKNGDEVYARLKNINDDFFKVTALQSFARNQKLAPEILSAIYEEFKNNPSVMESLSKNTSTDKEILKQLMKKGHSRVKRFAEETLSILES